MNVRRNLTFQECESFSYSSLHHSFESENIRFPFSKKIKLIMGVKCEKLYSENRREFIRQALKIVPGWNGLSEFLAVLKK